MSTGARVAAHTPPPLCFIDLQLYPSLAQRISRNVLELYLTLFLRPGSWRPLLASRQEAC